MRGRERERSDVKGERERERSDGKGEREKEIGVTVG